MFLVHMDANHRLIVCQMFLCKLFGNLQCHLRCDLSGLEGLDDMVILHAILLTKFSFGIQHLTALHTGIAVQIGGQNSVICFISVEYIVDACIEPPLSGKDLCDGHYFFAT